MRREPEGFADFVAARGLALRRTAMLLTQDAQLAEDLVQTALAKAWPRWHKLDAPEAYVRKVMAHQFYRDRRRRWTGETPTQTLPELATGADSAERIALQDSVVRAMAALPRKQLAVLVLRYFHDFSEQQIADSLGVSTGTVKSHASRGLATLRDSDHLSDSTEGSTR
ncbi:SigE family RNA polymerase sigma factor [Luteipulveratus mongoliensis]|uniref:SigE family RNA polymerase sigma factor n=1 Tax=Luteipulveratus mongoliensis TaxID=571913 RepID=A0A0K1JKY5_9MICO|nr:SigE family RNA polymerase sigma factor [Luteipulveratus mongoliensis]AKU17394.1 hypothetical protein VV02_18630 [Luteipulveratus mongoliensis]